MESVPYLIALFVLAAVLGTLYWLSLRQMRTSFDQQSTALTRVTDLQVQAAMNAQAAATAGMEQNRKAMELAIAATTGEMRRQQEMTAKQTVEMISTSLAGSNKAQERLSQMLQSAMTALATKDPIAYSQLLSASPPEQTGGAPYTSADEVAQQDLEKRARDMASLTEAENLMRELVGHGTAGYGADSGSTAFGEP